MFKSIDNELCQKKQQFLYLQKKLKLILDVFLQYKISIDNELHQKKQFPYLQEKLKLILDVFLQYIISVSLCTGVTGSE